MPAPAGHRDDIKPLGDPRRDEGELRAIWRPCKRGFSPGDLTLVHAVWADDMKSDVPSRTAERVERDQLPVRRPRRESTTGDLPTTLPVWAREKYSERQLGMTISVSQAALIGERAPVWRPARLLRVRNHSMPRPAGNVDDGRAPGPTFLKRITATARPDSKPAPVSRPGRRNRIFGARSAWPSRRTPVPSSFMTARRLPWRKAIRPSGPRDNPMPATFRGRTFEPSVETE